MTVAGPSQMLPAGPPVKPSSADVSVPQQVNGTYSGSSSPPVVVVAPNSSVSSAVASKSSSSAHSTTSTTAAATPGVLPPHPQAVAGIHSQVKASSAVGGSVVRATPAIDALGRTLHGSCC